MTFVKMKWISKCEALGPRDHSMNKNCCDFAEASMTITMTLEDLALHFHFLFPVSFETIRKYTASLQR